MALENLRGGMERLLFVNAPRWRTLTEKHVVDYCAWGHPYKKPENLWVSDFGWTSTGTTGNGRCNSNCDSGSIRADAGRHIHFKVLSLQLVQVQQDQVPRGRRMQCPFSC